MNRALRLMMINLLHVPLLVLQLHIFICIIPSLSILLPSLASWLSHPHYLVAALAMIGHVIGFWLIGGVLSSFQHFGVSGKLQVKRATQPLAGIGLVILNCFIGLGITVACFCVLLPSIDTPLPTFSVTVRDVLVFVAIEEFLFFHLHWLGHRSPFLYRHIHKVHHRFSSPSAYHVLYTHPIEHAFVNILPLVLGPVLMGSHVMLAILWLSAGQVTSLVAHSGYILPLVPTNPLHDLHHEHFAGNFGVLGFFDFLYGTLKVS